MAYQPLACSLYDLVEVFCMRGYDIVIETTEAKVVEGTALTTRTSSTDGEFIQVESAHGLWEIRLDKVIAITVLSDGSGFGRVEFGAGPCAV
jgi:Rho-binding antiterminator